MFCRKIIIFGRFRVVFADENYSAFALHNAGGIDKFIKNRSKRPFFFLLAPLGVSSEVIRVRSVLGNDCARSSPSPLRGTPPVLRGRVRSVAKREAPPPRTGEVSRRDGGGDSAHLAQSFQRTGINVPFTSSVAGWGSVRAGVNASFTVSVQL